MSEKILLEYYLRVIIKNNLYTALIYAACITTLIVIPPLLDPYNLPKLLFLIVATGVISALFLANSKNLSISNFKTVIWVPLILSLIFLISGLSNNQNLHQIFLGTYQRNLGIFSYFCFGAFFTLIAINRNIDVPNQIISALSFLGGVLSIVGFLQRSEALKVSAALAAVSVKTTFGNIDMAAAFLGMTGTATIYLILRTKYSLIIKLVLVISYYCHYNLLFDSPAKQGRVLFVLGSAFILGFWLITNKKKWIRIFGFGYWLAVFNLLMLASIALFSHGPLKNIFQSDRASLDDRIRFSKVAIKMGLDNPIFGVGVDEFGNWFRRYQSVEDFQMIKQTNAGNVDNPHNLFMQFFATGGVPLIIFYSVFIGFILYRSIIAISKGKDKFLAGGLFSVWAVFQAQSLFSIDQISITIWGWVVGGGLVSLSYLNLESETLDSVEKSKPPRTINIRNSYLTILIVVIAQIPSFYMITVMKNHIDFGNSSDKLRFTNPQSSDAASNSESFLKISLNNQEPYLRVMAVRLLNDFGQIDLMLTLSKETVKHYPNYFEGWDTLATIYEQTGRKSLAVDARQRTVELDPLNEELKILLASDKQSLLVAR